MLVKFHRNIRVLNLSENIAKSFRGLLCFDSHCIYYFRTDVESDIRHWSRLPVSEQANGWQGVATCVVSDMTPPSDIRYAEITVKRAQWLNWPYDGVSVDWSGASPGVYSHACSTRVVVIYDWGRYRAATVLTSLWPTPARRIRSFEMD